MAEFLQQCGSWGVLATLAAYAAGVWINRKTGKALFNPLLMGSIFVIVFLSCFGVPYADYKSSAQPVNWLLMPATVSLAIPLYEKVQASVFRNLSLRKTRYQRTFFIV